MPHNYEYDAKTKQSLDEFVLYLHDEMTNVRVSVEEYTIVNQLLAERMDRIYQMKDAFIGLLPIDGRFAVEGVALSLVNIVWDSLSRLAADAREGMEYELFLKRVEEEREIWHEQLRIS